jgi:signal transduction histidine kinase
MVALAITSMLAALHQFRVKGLIEVERLRRRIAADLHDDIGASLSRVAILSEVVKRQVGQENGEPAHRLSEIADTARGLVDSMSDIVWSVDPRRDDLHNVVLRVREFAYEILEGRSVSWDVTAPEGLEKVKLNPEQRRHLYLILKESLANIARHSGSGCITMAIRLDSSHIRAEVRDDGCGFDSAKSNGHGLENMRFRAAQLGGALSVETAVGSGTRIILAIPLKRFGA